MELPPLTPAALRAQTLGADAVVETPVGERPLVYADFTASGRQLAFVEDYLRSLAPLYANSHTEDSLTGRTATRLLHDAERAIKRAVGAGPSGRVVCCGAGSTGAIHKLQEILGVAIPPATLRDLGARLTKALGDEDAGRLMGDLRETGPVVFVGPYEHHSNEVTWREGLCTVVEVGLDAQGQVCLDDLERHLTDPQWAGRTMYGSFSAGSNVTGVLAPVREIARVLHRHGALAFFDYAAAGPYVEIDMAPEGDPEARIDAVFLSPHKFLGGPGSSGVLVFNAALYPDGLAPTVGGGGTVAYVNATDHDYVDDVEARETAGTPGLYQALRAAIALDVKRAVGVDAIHAREREHLARVLARWGRDDRIEILGPGAEVERLPIVSFNVRDGLGGVLHPRFVTVLLCDLFGVQSRAGCSCAGPYGHRLLDIGAALSARYRQCLVDGVHGLKPGWARVGFHYTHDDDEIEYLIRAVELVAEHGARFLALYDFDVATGEWTVRAGRASGAALSLAEVVAGRAAAEPRTISGADRADLMRRALAEAEQMARDLPPASAGGRLDDDLADLQFFALPA
ncbi:aminotransferase class V-fold PLP-dependent enzyme [Rubrivirga sp.]|uniref:aminotransferase class V-fold PLP-dependent enzyme n=1 Tax=Rubrivirga sp. TaxID=1885344 RepID=UPI003B5197D3